MHDAPVQRAHRVHFLLCIHLARSIASIAEMYKTNCAKNNYAASCFNLGRLKRTATEHSIAMDRLRAAHSLSCLLNARSGWQRRRDERL